MCVLFLAFKQHQSHPLILLANRDEYYSRPTLAAGEWDDSPDIFGGRDLLCGGTWLAVSRDGRFGAVTNFRDPNARAGTISRGRLVADYLRSDAGPAEFLEDISPAAPDYSGFNLIVGEVSSRRTKVCYFSNRGGQITDLKPGIYGLSNHLLDTPWPKVRTGKARLGNLLRAQETGEDRLFEILADETLADDRDLPSTGLPPKTEKALSAIFIKTPGYGTRSSALLRFDRDLEWKLEERVWI